MFTPIGVQGVRRGGAELVDFVCSQWTDAVMCLRDLLGMLFNGCTTVVEPLFPDANCPETVMRAGILINGTLQEDIIIGRRRLRDMQTQKQYISLKRHEVTERQLPTGHR